MKKSLVITARVLILSIITALALLYTFQRALIFPGAYHLHKVEAPINPKELEIIPLKTEDNLNVQLYKLISQKKKNKAILMFHGNADLASNRIYTLRSLADTFDIFALEYRGYNGNKGRPSEENINNDAKSALKYLEEQGYKTIVYYGHSIGTAVAVRLVKDQIPAALILDAPLNDLASAAGISFPYLPKPLINILLRDDYNSKKTLNEIIVPNVLVMHGTNDDVLDYSLGVDLFASINSPNKTFKTYQGANHNNLPRYNPQDLKNFLSKI